MGMTVFFIAMLLAPSIATASLDATRKIAFVSVMYGDLDI